MEIVTTYHAEDGKIFLTEGECKRYEELIADLLRFDNMLERLPFDDIDFMGGNGYIQQNELVVKDIQLKIFTRIDSILKLDYVRSILNDKKILEFDKSYINYLIGDYKILESFRNLWNRFMCMDSHYREWGQQHYANSILAHTGVINKCLNPTEETK